MNMVLCLKACTLRCSSSCHMTKVLLYTLKGQFTQIISESGFFLHHFSGLGQENQPFLYFFFNELIVESFASQMSHWNVRICFVLGSTYIDNICCWHVLPVPNSAQWSNLLK